LEGDFALAQQKGRKASYIRKGLSSMIVGSLLAVSLAGVPQNAHADEEWDNWQIAETLEISGKLAAAVPHWDFLSHHYAATGSWENAALFAGKLDAYYDAAGDYENAIKYYELENEYWVKAGKDWGAVKIQRADQIRSTVELYRTETDSAVAKATASGTKGGLSKFEPEYGTYIGIYSELDPKVGNYFTKNEQLFGKKHAIYLAYASYGKDFPKAYASRAKEAGGGLQIAWEPFDGLDAVVDGPYLHKWAQDAKAAGIPIFLRYASEMNGNWVKWNGDPQKYIEKFRMIHDIFAKEAPNVAMVWSPGDVPANTIDQYYPGDDYVDWVGVSLYIEPYENGNPALPSMIATSAVERLTNLYNTYASRKPMMLSETGVPHYSNSANEDFTEWAKLNLQRLYEIMPYKYPRLKAITYFNVDQKLANAKNNYSLSDTAQITSYYKKLIANPYLLSNIEQGAKPSGEVGYVKVDASHQTFMKSTRIVPFVKIPDVYIGRVDYVLNGSVIASQSDAPFGIDLKAGDVPDGSTMELKVYNKSGKLVVSKAFGFASQVAVNIDGIDKKFEQPPVIINGSTMAPLRAIFEALGAKVEYEDSTKTVTATKGDITLKLGIGQKQITKNGKTVDLDQPAQLVNGFTMAPARFVGETFGGKVAWDGNSRTVTIATK
jgi:hypothetical protein